MSSNSAPRSIFGGVLPVLETPFTSHGDVDLVSFDCLVKHVSSLAVNGMMFPGFASEFSKLNQDERHALNLLVVAGARENSVASVLSIPDHATRFAVEEAEWAADHGATALNLLPPSFLSPSVDEIKAHIAAVLAAVPNVPVIVQLAPGLTGSVLPAAELVALAERYDNLQAVKVENVPPGKSVSLFGQLRPQLPCLVGYAGLYLPDSLARGAVGVQPGCSFVELYVAMWDFWRAGEIDSFSSLHRRLAPYLLEWMENVELIVQVEKRISMRRGLIASDFCRRPGYQLDQHQEAGVERFLLEFADELATF